MVRFVGRVAAVVGSELVGKDSGQCLPPAAASFMAFNRMAICSGINTQAGKMEVAAGRVAAVVESELAGKDSSQCLPPAAASFMAFNRMAICSGINTKVG